MTCILERWTYRSASAGREIVFPDGCRDLIVIRRPSAAASCFVSDLQTAPRWVIVPPGGEWSGIRLKPGVRIDEDLLVERAQRCDCDPVRIGSLIEEHCHLPEGIDEAVRCLSQEASSVAQAAKAIGISQRSLQRLFRAQGLHPPEFWLMLARARQAASWISPQESLADVAAAAGYADQAHMTREFRRWFGVSPARLRREARLLHLLRQSGLGTPATGEHSSTR